jgi:phosphatidylinositol alpha-1,6-mannosyltransferase
VRTLVVTNDFPPRPGGIQAYVHSLAVRQPADEVVVYASSWKGAAAFDAEQPFPVVRAGTSVLLPTRGVLREARGIAKAEGCDRVWFGAAAPLGLLAKGLGLERSVASTHGHEVAWARLPALRQVLAKVGRDVDGLTCLGEYTRSRLSGVMRAPFTTLPPGVDATVFRPDSGGDEVRARLGLTNRPVVVCVSRLVPRKGQDVLVRALPLIRRRVPGTALLLVGGGPNAPRLRELAADLGVADDVVLTGSVPWEELPAHHDAGDVFARSRGSASSSSRRPPPASPWSPGGRAARRTPCGTERPGTSWTARRSPRWPIGWPRCSRTPRRRARWGLREGPGSSRSGSGTCWPAACASC